MSVYSQKLWQLPAQGDSEKGHYFLPLVSIGCHFPTLHLSFQLLTTTFSPEGLFYSGLFIIVESHSVWNTAICLSIAQLIDILVLPTFSVAENNAMNSDAFVSTYVFISPDYVTGSGIARSYM